MAIEVHPVTPDRWDDLVALFGERGAYDGCWCTWWRQTSSEYGRNRGAGNREMLRGLVERGEEPGLIAYIDGEPVGWISVGPREDFGRLQRSPKLKPIDDRPAWAIVCFYVDKAARNAGVGRALLDAAVEHVAERGGELVEGYPVAPRDRFDAAATYTGTTGMFARAGFSEAARRGGRPIVRRELR